GPGAGRPPGDPGAELPMAGPDQWPVRIRSRLGDPRGRRGGALSVTWFTWWLGMRLGLLSSVATFYVVVLIVHGPHPRRPRPWVRPAPVPAARRSIAALVLLSFLVAGWLGPASAAIANTGMVIAAAQPDERSPGLPDAVVDRWRPTGRRRGWARRVSGGPI